ncbi:hypothetical protein MNEG_0058 [Monoraphidium neglectum]|uniref:MYND-type domain-containing protein n=1 Tax=Monoraphidium neglectum TaxID=145388 RepID=A0A0D2KCU0_9CHLO|nr:hypothetical protein MNEG_0058 [Monoraphidium neglectum]KIZ07903.1 hypothetical protein MNEG_0058 [Monoraphidium neglectum]|eukprot:XP_013906922.1 hypothetical protein MNEG_0058 [Monoraphidium neglectum]
MALLARGELACEAAGHDGIMRGVAAWLGRAAAELRRVRLARDAASLRGALLSAGAAAEAAAGLACWPGAAKSAAARDGSLVRELLGAALLQLPDCTAEATDVLRAWQCKAHAAAGLRLLVAGALLDAAGGAPRLTGAGAWDEVLCAAPSLLRESAAVLVAHRGRRQGEGDGEAVVGGSCASSDRSGGGGHSGSGTGSGSATAGGSGSGSSGAQHGAERPESNADATADAAHKTCAAVCSTAALVLLIDTQEPEGNSSGGSSSSSSSCAGPALEELHAAAAGVCGCGRLTGQALLAMVEAARGLEAAAASGDTAACELLRPMLARLLANARRLADAHATAPCEEGSPESSSLRPTQVEGRAGPSQLSGGSGRCGGEAAAFYWPPAPAMNSVRIGTAALRDAVQRPLTGCAGAPRPICRVCVGGDSAEASRGGCGTSAAPEIGAALRKVYAEPLPLKRSAPLAVMLAAVEPAVACAAAPGDGPAQDCLAPRAPGSGRTRGCAYCGRTSAQGAALRRCAGCGALTGVRYCSQACCRNHWVRTGHRQQCEEAQRQLREQIVQQQ